MTNAYSCGNQTVKGRGWGFEAFLIDVNHIRVAGGSNEGRISKYRYSVLRMNFDNMMI